MDAPSFIMVTAPAKINLYLGVHPHKDERGYHRVDTVMTAIDLADTLAIAPADELMVRTVPEAGFPMEENTAYRAAVAMGEAFGREPRFTILIDKHIPIKSGLGGPSTDAAATIKGICHLWKIDPADERIDRVARSIGADVPFFLYGPPAYFTGAGDVMREVFRPLTGTPVALVKPLDGGVSTGEAYAHFDADPQDLPELDPMLAAMREHDEASIFAHIGNNLEVGVGAIGLHGGELGVVREVHALVAEDAPKLENALVAAHEQALEMQLGGDAQVVLLVQCVEVRDERLGRSTALDGLEDGGLDLHVAVVLHVAAEGRHDARALGESLADVGVHDEVDVALAIARLLVGQAMELLGQRADSLGQQRKLARSHGELAALGADHDALGAHDVAQVELAEQLPGVFRHVVDAAEQLHVAGGVAQHDEHDLALAALGDHAAADLHDIGGVLAVGQIGVVLLDVSHVIGDIRVLGIRVLAGSVQRRAIGQTARTLVVERGSRINLGLVHGVSSYIT